MRKKWLFQGMILIAFAVFALLAGRVALAQTGSYNLDWWTVDGGGGTSTGGNYTLRGTIGQPDATQSMLTGNTYTLAGGFWSAFGGGGDTDVYLPLVIKND